MEGAAGGVVLAGLFQLDARGDHVDDVGAVEQVIDKRLWDQAGHRRSEYCHALGQNRVGQKLKDSDRHPRVARSLKAKPGQAGCQALLVLISTGERCGAARAALSWRDA